MKMPGGDITENRSAQGYLEPMRPAILKVLVVCLAVAVAPWLSGGQEPLAMLISSFALLLGSLLIWRQPMARAFRHGPLLTAFLLLVGLAGLSLMWTANRYSSELWIVQWVIAALSFRLAYIIAGEEKGVKWVIRAYLISAIIFCIVAIVIYLTSEYGRLTGTFYWANPAAAYLMPAIMLSIDGLYRSKKRRRNAVIWMGLGTLFAMSFLLADSRATSVVMAVILGIYLLLVKLNRRFWIQLLLMVLLAVGCSYGVVKLGSQIVAHSQKVVPGSRIAQAVSGESTSGNDRLLYLGSALKMWLTHPLGGEGAGTYGDVHPSFQQRVISASTNAHNEYFQILAELGIFGGIILGVLILCLLLGSLRGLVRVPALIPLSLGGIGLLMHMGLDIDASYPALLGLVAVIFGMTFAQGGDVRRRVSWRLPTLAGLVLIPVVSLYYSGVWADRAAAAQNDSDYSLAASEYARASSGLVFNPDYLTAEGINRLTLAEGGANTVAGGTRTQIDLAMDLALQAQKLDRYDGQHQQLEGRILVAKGDLKGAEAAFKRALKLDPLNHPDYALDLATASLRDNKTGEAVRTANSMLALYPPGVVANRAADETVAPNLADLEALVGNVALKAGDLKEADISADRALALDPKNLSGRALKHQVVKLTAQTP